MSDEIKEEVKITEAEGQVVQNETVTAPVSPEQKTEEVTAPELPQVAPVEDGTITPGVTTDQTVVMYNGQAVTKRLGLFDADGAQECELADGTTAFVPKSVLGE